MSVTLYDQVTNNMYQEILNLHLGQTINWPINHTIIKSSDDSTDRYDVLHGIKSNMKPDKPMLI